MKLPFVLVLVRLLIVDVSCVSVAMVRSEQGEKAAEVLSSGAMRHSSEQEAKNTCSNQDYPMGKPGTCECEDSQNHHVVMNEDDCAEAAAEAGVTAMRSTEKFVIFSHMYHKRPRGCYKHFCAEDDKKICYFFNPVGDDGPAQCSGVPLADGSTPTVEGTPVCKRDKYLAGEPNDNDGCPTDLGYGTVMDQYNCSTAASCITKVGGEHVSVCLGEPFVVTTHNKSRHDDYPLGCYIDATDGCAYWNPPLEGWDAPRWPVGRPICNVTVRTWWTGTEDDIPETVAAVDGNNFGLIETEKAFG